MRCWRIAARRSDFSTRVAARSPLSLSLLLANAGAYLAGASWQRFADRVQILGAVWIWLLVQLGCMVYMLYARV